VRGASNLLALVLTLKSGKMGGVMKAKFFLLCIALAVYSCSKTSSQADGNPSSSYKSLVVVYENDVHCNMEGYAKFAGLRDLIADTADVATVSSGDFLQGGALGTISHGGYVIPLVNKVGYDAMALGNHELDYKFPRLFEIADSLTPPIICSNLVFKGSSTPLFKPYVLKQIGSNKIAFVGALSPDAIVTESYAFEDDSLKTSYDIPASNRFQLVQAAVNEARQAGADFVILLSHFGLEPPFTSTELIQNTFGIDAVLDGHSHSVIEEAFVPNLNGDSILVSQTGTKFQNVGVLSLTPNGKFHSRLIPLDSITIINEGVKVTYDSLYALAVQDLQTVVSSTQFDLTINSDDGNRLVRKGETNLADFVADAFRYAFKADIGLVNGGGVRATISAGNITYQNVLDVMPFANDMCLVRATGQQIKSVLAEGASHLPDEFGGFLQVSGLRYEVILDSMPRIGKVQVETSQGYTEIIDDQFYTVGTSSYVAYAGAETKSLRQSEIIIDKMMTDDEAVMKYIKHLGSEIPDVYRTSQGRIVIRPATN